MIQAEPSAFLSESTVQFNFKTEVNDTWEPDSDMIME